ncbi:PadR family transcriptional regulator [bacterium]|nr:MAG: PadR family transcriptional regulator [bacterium]
MIEQELILLGLLKESPKHGYEIKIKIKEILFLFAGIELKSIYYPLGILERRGLITKRKSKLGKRPERLVYKLTPQGSSRFNELLNKSFLNFKRPQFSLDLSLYFLPYAKPKIARRRLRGRIFILNKVARELKQLLRLQRKNPVPASPLCIIEHNLRMMEAETKFLTNLIKTI